MSAASIPPPKNGSSTSEPAFELRLVGVNHQTAPAGVREALAYSEPEAVRWVHLAVEEGAVDLGGPSIREAALLCTCNRTEAYLVLAPRPEEPHDPKIERRLVRLLCGTRPDLASDHMDAFYLRRGPEAARHLYRVASGLDSMVQGEAQILGQVHRAHDLAREADGIGPILDRLFTTAFHAGKRARSETEIGRGAVSVASASVELATKVVGSLAKRAVLVVGAGETGRLVAQHLASERPSELMVANRTLEKAKILASEVGGRALDLSELAAAMARADVVIAAIAAPSPLITRPMVETVLKRHRRSTVLIDISVPRSIEPGVHDLEGAFLYDMDALQKVVYENLVRREGEVPKVEAILDHEVGQYTRWFASLAAGPLIAHLRDHFEQVRREEVRRHAKGLKPGELDAVERATRGLLNKMLHGPTVHLRNDGGSDPESCDLVRRMFQIGESPAGPAGASPDPESLGNDATRVAAPADAVSSKGPAIPGGPAGASSSPAAEGA